MDSNKGFLDKIKDEWQAKGWDTAALNYRMDTDLTPEVNEEQLTAYLDGKFGTDQTGGGSDATGNDIPGDTDDDDSLGVGDDVDDATGEDTDVNDDDDTSTTDDPTDTQRYEVTVDDNGTVATFTANELRAFHDFQQRLKTDPQFQEYLGSYTPPTPGSAGGIPTPTPVTPPPPVETTIPDDLDLDDPNIKFLVERQQALEAQLASVQQTATITYQQAQAQQAQQVEGLITTARESFQEKFKVSEEDAIKILDVAGRSGNAQTYMKGIDPLTGVPVNPNPISAVTRAMEMAMWAMPEYREKAIKDEASASRKQRVKASKLTALSGNSGSVSRNIQSPKNPAERRAAMIQEVATAMDAGALAQ